MAGNVSFIFPAACGTQIPAALPFGCLWMMLISVPELHLRVGISNGWVVDQVPHFEGQGPAQGGEQVQRGGELPELNALDGGLFHVGDVGELLLGVAAGLA